MTTCGTSTRGAPGEPTTPAGNADRRALSMRCTHAKMRKSQKEETTQEANQKEAVNSQMTNTQTIPPSQSQKASRKRRRREKKAQRLKQLTARRLPGPTPFPQVTRNSTSRNSGKIIEKPKVPPALISEAEDAHEPSSPPKQNTGQQEAVCQNQKQTSAERNSGMNSPPQVKAIRKCGVVGSNYSNSVQAFRLPRETRGGRRRARVRNS